MNTLVQHYLPKLQLLLFYFVLITYPLNLFFNLLPTYGYVRGLQIDYLLPKLYFSQIGIICLLAVYTLQQLLANKLQHFSLYSHFFPITIILVLLTRSFFTPYPLASFYFTVQIILNLSFGLWIWKIRTLLSTKVIYIVILGTIIFQIALALMQFITQRAVLPYRYFGETQIQHSIGIAKSDFSQLEKVIGRDWGLRLLPHGTFPHPNVFAGFLVLNILILMRTNLSIGVKTGISLLVVSIILILGSFSAIVTLIVGSMFIWFKSAFQSMNKQIQHMFLKRVIVISIILLVAVPLLLSEYSQFSTSPSVDRRHTLNVIAVDIIKGHPLLGLGLNQFTTQVENYARNSEIVSFVQPAHYVPLLLLSEVGFAGLFIIFYFVWKYGRKMINLDYWKVATFMTIIPLVSLDHYLYTLHQGQVLLILFLLLFGLSDNFLEKNN